MRVAVGEFHARRIYPLCAICVLRLPVLIRDNLHVTQLVNCVYVHGFGFFFFFGILSMHTYTCNVLLLKTCASWFIRSQMRKPKIREQFFPKMFAIFFFDNSKDIANRVPGSFFIAPLAPIDNVIIRAYNIWTVQKNQICNKKPLPKLC